MVKLATSIVATALALCPADVRAQSAVKIVGLGAATCATFRESHVPPRQSACRVKIRDLRAFWRWP